ncbi:MAG: hypothetical protein ACPGGK_03920 [Pikeienuella sp.]
MRTAAIRLLQKQLAAQGHYADKIDGQRGPNTDNAARSAVNARATEVTGDPATWSNKRVVVAAYQLLITDEGFDVGPVDGLWGQRTDYGDEALREKTNTGNKRLWRDAPPPPNPHGWPTDSRDQAALVAFYGEPGNPDCTRGKIRLPWKMKLAWKPTSTVSRFSCHIKVEDSLNTIFAALEAAYSEQEIKALGLDLFGGCFNKRLKRGGSNWSLHSWGVALDIDPSNNKLKWRSDRARMARPEYDPWWEAWEAEGWIGLGRARNFDWMHVQAARL